MRIITVEEHFQHPEVSARVAQLAGPPPMVASEGLAEFLGAFELDADSAARLGGHRLAHMDQVGIDVQVVSHGNGSPSTLRHPEAVELCRRVNDDLAAELSEHPDRFRGFATLPLYDPAAAAEELRRCVGDLGFVGALTAGTYDDNQLNVMLAELGAERIIHSEDFPYVVRDNVSTFLEHAGLSEADTHAIAHNNGEALLGI